LVEGLGLPESRAVFVTISFKDRRHYFGEIQDGVMGLSAPGCIAWHYWMQIPNHQSWLVLDQFVVMPNHLHGIIGIESANESVGTLHATSVQDYEIAEDSMLSISPEAGCSISAIFRSYKSVITKWCNVNGHEYFAWQSRFHDHIIRNEKEWQWIRKYIYDNPLC